MANRIHNLLTKYGHRDGEKVPIMTIGLYVDDLDDIDAFMTEVGAAFRSQRMISPPETRALFVTLLGALTATEFKRRWAEQSRRDPALRSIMVRMETAAVLHWERDGTVIDHLSLIDGGLDRLQRKVPARAQRSPFHRPSQTASASRHR